MDYTSTPAHLLPSPVTLPGVGYLEFNPRTGVYERRISPLAPVGDWAEGLDQLPPTTQEHRARAPRAATPVRSTRYLRIRGAVRFLVGMLSAGAFVTLASLPEYLAR